MKIGVLALQGAVREHRSCLKACGAEPVEIKYKQQLAEIDGLIIPGGESATAGKLLIRHEMLEILSEMGRNGFPIFYCFNMGYRNRYWNRLLSKGKM
jgi:5'-phosphate synthase pdxT subunit